MTPVSSTSDLKDNLERRLSVLELQVGGNKSGISSTGLQTDPAFSSINDRLTRIRLDLEGKITTSSAQGTKNADNLNLQLWKEIEKLLRELDPGVGLTHQQQPLLYKRQQVLASSNELSSSFKLLDAILNLLLTATKKNGTESKNSSCDFTTANSASLSAGDNFVIGNKRGVGATMNVAENSTMTNVGQSSASTVERNKSQYANKDRASQQRYNNQQAGQSGGSKPIRLDEVTQAPILTQHMATTSAHPEDQKRIEELRLKLKDIQGRTTVLAQTLRYYLECYHSAAAAVSEKIVLADERITMAVSTKNTAQ